MTGCVFAVWVLLASVVAVAMGVVAVFVAGACFGYNARKTEEKSKECEG